VLLASPTGDRTKFTATATGHVLWAVNTQNKYDVANVVLFLSVKRNLKTKASVIDCECNLCYRVVAY